MHRLEKLFNGLQASLVVLTKQTAKKFLFLSFAAWFSRFSNALAGCFSPRSLLSLAVPLLLIPPTLSFSTLRKSQTRPTLSSHRCLCFASQNKTGSFIRHGHLDDVKRDVLMSSHLALFWFLLVFFTFFFSNVSTEIKGWPVPDAFCPTEGLTGLKEKFSF